MSEFIYHCPHCGQKMECDSEQFDGTVIANCPKCQQEICPEDSGEKPQPEIIKLPPRKTEPERIEPPKQSTPEPEQGKPEKKPLTLEEKLKREHNNQEKYTYPWLCYVFNISAALNGIGIIASLVFLEAAINQKKDCVLPLLALVFCLFSIIINIGISQLIAFIGETTYNTKILRIIAEHSVTGSTQDSNTEEYTPGKLASRILDIIDPK